MRRLLHGLLRFLSSPRSSLVVLGVAAAPTLATSFSRAGNKLLGEPGLGGALGLFVCVVLVVNSWPCKPAVKERTET